MVQDFQAILDFMSRDKKEFVLDNPVVKKEIQDFVRIYIKEKGFYELLIADPQLNVIASKTGRLISRLSTDPMMKKVIQTGAWNAEVEKSGTFLSTYYKKMVIYSPLWHRGKIIGGIQFYERKEIKDILAYLRLIANPFDRISFFRIYNVPQRGLGKKFEEEFDACWQQEPLFTFFEVGQQLINAGELSGKKAAEMQDFIALIQALNYESKPSDCINHILATTQYFSYLKATFDPVEAEAKIENVKELLRAVAYFEEQGINTVALLLHEITLMQEKIALSKDHHDHVQLMTLHAAKGLEFDIIALSGLEEGLFPSTHSLYDPASIEEERRLFYVGITRAKEHILFSHARYRYTFGTMNDQTSSRFLDEIPEHLAHRSDASGWDTLQSSSFFSQWLGKSIIILHVLK